MCLHKRIWKDTEQEVAVHGEKQGPGKWKTVLLDAY